MQIVDGDIFACDTDVILHQVNCQGVMGSGVAKQVHEKYPKVYQMYKHICDWYHNERVLLGCAQGVSVESLVTGKELTIVNLFAQYQYGLGTCHTDYVALRDCFKKVNELYKGKRIAIPYLIGCFRGGGNWDVVSQMIADELTDCDVTLYRLVEGR